MGLQMTGILLLGFSAAALGFRAAFLQERKLQNYWQLRQNLEQLYSAVDAGTMLEEALENCRAGRARFWQATAQNLRKKAGEGLAQIWRQGAERAGAGLGLEKQERERFAALGQVLGTGDRAECCRQLRAFQDYLAGQETQRTQLLRQKVQLYRKLGLMTGALIIVLLL